jgi:hypothetical protein
MDTERGEDLDRECNWALVGFCSSQFWLLECLANVFDQVEFKLLPVNATTATGGSDPRTSNTLMLFEEFVPLEYRQQLAETTTGRRRLPSLFSPSNKPNQ